MIRPPIPRESVPTMAERLEAIERELAVLRQSSLDAKREVDGMRSRADTITNEIGNLSESFGRVIAVVARTEQDVLALKSELGGIRAAQGAIVTRLDRLLNLAELVKSKSFWSVASEVARLVAVAVAVGVATYAATPKNEPTPTTWPQK